MRYLGPFHPEMMEQSLQESVLAYRKFVYPTACSGSACLSMHVPCTLSWKSCSRDISNEHPTDIPVLAVNTAPDLQWSGLLDTRQLNPKNSTLSQRRWRFVFLSPLRDVERDRLFFGVP
jgi:hypothetical protein